MCNLLPAKTAGPILWKRPKVAHRSCFMPTKFYLTNCRRNHEENVTGLEFAGDTNKEAQVQQKQQQDVFAHSATFVEGEHVMVYMPAKSGKEYKFGKAKP